MAQLPPKIPNIMLPNHLHNHNSLHHQWPEFKNEHEHEHGHDSKPSWVDEFMEFSAAKRGAHRRTMSDSSVTFLDAGGPAVPTAFNDVMLSKSTGDDQRHHHDVVENEQFEKFDDEQFMSMFSNEMGSCSNPSSMSDHNSTNDDQKGAAAVEGTAGGGGGGGGGGGEEKERAEEVESSSCKQQGVKLEGEKSEATVGYNSNNAGGSNGDNQLLADPKRVKRILANRQSAQRSRVRKLQYISELERSVTALQSEVSVLSPRVAFLDHQRMLLNLDNSALKSKLAALAQDKIFKDAHQEALKREIERLRQVYYQQNLQRNDGSMTPQSSSPLPSPGVQHPRPDIRDNDNEQPTA